MPTIRIIDGSRDVKFGKALLPALGEIAKYQRVILYGPQPGSCDIPGYNVVQNAERIAYNASRNQVDSRKLALCVLNNPSVKYQDGIDTIILSEKDFYNYRVDWGFGSATRDNRSNGILAVSTYRLQDLQAFTHVVTHELGHLYGAASKGRSSTEEKLGSHCTNLCIMQQKLSVPDMIVHVRQIGQLQDKFCTQCQHDLLNYR
jgi:predicted Zn-dependent protease